MSGFDLGRQYNTRVLPGSNATETASGQETLAQTEKNLYDFIQRFRLGNDFIYRDRLRANLLAKQYVVEVQLEHVQLWSANLAQELRERPEKILPLVSLSPAFPSSAADPPSSLPSLNRRCGRLHDGFCTRSRRPRGTRTSGRRRPTAR